MRQKKTETPKDKFYDDCATIIQRILTNRSTLKKEVYKTKTPKRYLAVLSQILKHKNNYESILSKLNFKLKNKYISLVYVHEIIAGNLDLNNYITKSIIKLSKEYNFDKGTQITYFRINTLNTSEEEMKDIIESVEGAEATIVPNVYKVSNYSFYDKEVYKQGKIILQNFSSCLPAFILNPEMDSNVIDCCAAPGNKTSHLAMIMGNTGRITAYEKNKDRYGILNRMMEKHCVKNVTIHHADFLEVDPNESADFVLVDPSCTGSGIHSFYERDDERVKNVSTFQKQILLHAMQFKDVKRIVYSTCSVHDEENEEVVEYVLQRNSNFRLKRIELDWNQRGNEKYEFYDKVIRCVKDEENNIQGFFVALFERVE